MSELFLFNSKRVIFDCNHGKNKFDFFWREDDYERKVLSSDDHQYQKRTPSLTSSQSGWGELIKRVIQQWPLLCETLIWRWVYPLYLYLCTNVWGNYPLYSCTFVWDGNTVVIMYDLWIYIRKVSSFLGGHWFPPLIKPTTTIWLKVLKIELNNHNTDTERTRRVPLG